MAERRLDEDRSTVSFALIVTATVLAFTLSRSEQITTQELWVGYCVAFTILAIGYRFIWRASRLPTPVYVALAYAFVIASNFAIAGLFGVSIENWARRAFVEICLPAFLVGAYLLSQRKARLLYGLAAAGGTILVLYSLRFWRDPGLSLLAVRASQAELGRMTALHLPVYGAALLTSLTLPFAVMRGRGRRLAALLLALGLAGVALGLSRTFWATTPIAILGTLVAIRSSRSTRILLALAIAGAGVLQLSDLGAVRRVIVTRAASQDESGAQRVAEARGLLEAMVEEPGSLLFGAGFGNSYTFVSVNEFATGGLGTELRDFSHNFYLEALWNTGVAGFTVLLALFWTTGRLLMRALRKRPEPMVAGVLCALLNFGLAALTYHPFGDLAWTILFGAILGVGVKIAGDVLATQPAPGTRVPSGPSFGPARLDPLPVSIARAR